jgi:hypothetical protein
LGRVGHGGNRRRWRAVRNSCVTGASRTS